MLRAWKYVGVTALFPVLGLYGCGASHESLPNGAGMAADGGGGSGGDGTGGSGDSGPEVAGTAPSGTATRTIGVKTVPNGGGGSGVVPSWNGDDAHAWVESGGAGGGTPAANDTCPGEAVALAPGSSVHINGTLDGANDDLTTFCADQSPDPGNPDVVYQLDVSADASVSVQLSSVAFNPALSLRLKTCTERVGSDMCLDFDSSLEKTKVSLAAGTYWLVVDSADGLTGSFTLNLEATTPVCGDGVLNAGEQCDPGPAASDDGCFDPGDAHECTFGELPMDTNVTACPGYGPVSVGLSLDPLSPTITRLGPHNNGSGAHAQMNDETADPAVCGWQAVGPENVFHVVPQAGGTLHARIGYDDGGLVMCDTNPLCGDFIMYVRQGTCAPADPPDAGQQMACVDSDPGFQEILETQVAVTAGGDYWVFVDGLDDTWGIGPYYLELWLL
jgi:hypothetical protein